VCICSCRLSESVSSYSAYNRSRSVHFITLFALHLSVHPYSSDVNSTMSRKTKKQSLLSSAYCNYVVDEGTVIDEVSIDDIESFFQQYIKIRKPVKLVSSSIQGVDLDQFKVENLASYLHYDEKLQVEKKFRAGFGSSQDRIKLTLSELISKFANGEDDLYLTTQYDFDDPDKKLSEEGGISDSDSDEEFDETNNSESSKHDTPDNESNEEQENLDSEDGHNLQSDKQNSTDVKDKNLDDDEDDRASLACSDTSSIDMNNLHDDYEDEDEEGDEGQEQLLSVDGVLISAEEATFRVKELLQPPLCNLAKTSFPIIPKIFDGLVPQQINLWMGYSATKKTNSYSLDENDEETFGLGKYIPGSKHGTSSGLHHDHADNLYILVSGSKRFTLFSPADAKKLATVGKIYKLFNSGIIDYHIDENAPNWKHIRDDGAIVEEIAHWMLEQEEITDDDEERLLRDIKEELAERKKAKQAKVGTNKLDPPNFSKIPPGLLHIDEFEEKDRCKIIDFANKHFPDVLLLNRLTVWLKPGEMLYLPAGWFHEVSSFGKESASQNLENVHIAINYWFVPPNDENNMYKDNYWKDDWKKTQASLKLVNLDKIEL